MEQIIFFFLMFFIIMVIIGNSKSDLDNNEAEEQLKELQKQILTSTGSTLPNKEIKQSFGLIRGISKRPAVSSPEFQMSEKEALHDILTQAKRLGANAIIDLQLNTGTYEQRGSRWQMAQVVYIGTAVKY